MRKQNFKYTQQRIHLSEVFCKKYCVKLWDEKTKLQVYTTKNSETVAHYMKEISPNNIEDKKIVLHFFYIVPFKKYF